MPCHATIITFLCAIMLRKRSKSERVCLTFWALSLAAQFDDSHCSTTFWFWTACNQSNQTKPNQCQ
jgi:hypothetical protein